MKKLISIILSTALILSNTVAGFSAVLITAEPVANTYVGRQYAANMIRNLTFSDVPSSHWASERIARAGALDMMKGGGNGRFNPDARVTNQEAIAFVMNVLGMENEAHQSAANIRATAPADSPLHTLWSLGYLNLARQNGLITAAQYADATQADQSRLTEPAFLREGDATRENVAQWLYQALQILDPGVFDPNASRQAIYTFTDYQDIDVGRVAAVEAMAANNIMTGANGRFNPKAPLTRAEMAALLSNLDSVYLPLAGLEKKVGTIGSVRDGQFSTTAAAELGREFRVRIDDGNVDVLQYFINQNSSPQSGTLDAPVYKNGNIGSMTNLAEFDRVEYLVDTETNEIVYIQVTGGTVVRDVQGRLQSVNSADLSVTISDAVDRAFTYPVASGLFGGGGIMFDGRNRQISELPIGSRISLRLVNNIVEELNYIGEPTVVHEMRGIVLDNNPDFGYIVFVDNNGNEVTKQYITGELMVEKRPYYMTNDTVGYLSHVFPNFAYNPRLSSATEIEPGDIIFMRLEPDDPDTITWLSAATNYMMRYGKILNFNVNGNSAGMLVEYENKQTAWFDLASGIPMTKGGRMISAANIVPGDWARFLINQAIVEPGAVIETVKEITVEGGTERFISNIVKGQVAGINAIQNQLIIQNAQTLAKEGWTDYQNLAHYSLAGNDIEFYANGSRVTLDYINQYLRRADGEVYIALENHFTGERVRRVTFRDSRDELLGADVVVNTTGDGGFMVTGLDGTIATDAGTIVRRHGRLVDGFTIIPPDWAVVSLNGHNRAAVVDITETPGNESVHIVRGRVLSVDEGKSFRVQSMATLVNNSWVFTPVQREFTIDRQTLFLDDGGGVLSIDEFMGFGDGSVVDQVFNIIVDGGRAARVIDSPYATASVRGLVYESADGSVSLRNAEYLNNTTGRWSLISNRNATLDISFTDGTIIVKENRIVGTNALVNGDFIRVMVPALTTAPQPGDSLDATIIRVDR